EGTRTTCLRSFKMCVSGAGVGSSDVAVMAEKRLRVPDIIITPPTPTGKALLRDPSLDGDEPQDTC
uniref:Uncharacterized protein n=1 Tax=Pseudonaja textilis TaxID=8673 RepID=A0A670Z2G9_PSETE